MKRSLQSQITRMKQPCRPEPQSSPSMSQFKGTDGLKRQDFYFELHAQTHAHIKLLAQIPKTTKALDSLGV